ncbi:hypothetical protein, partial [Bacteroides caecicola]|uniref:hypothetical protein n=1 Tax=Bacteroides caecicola TaxID=1462569 RepID=UPI0019560943
MENRSKHLNKIHILRHTSLFGIPPRGGIKKGRVRIGVSTPTGTLPCQNGGDLLSRLRSTI